MLHISLGNAILLRLTAIPVTLQKPSKSLFNLLPRAECVAFVTDTYKQQSYRSCQTNFPIKLAGFDPC